MGLDNRRERLPDSTGNIQHIGAGIAHVNGAFCSLENAKISIFDPGFTHSDAVYEVISTWKGSFFRLEEHITRFQASCRGFHLNLPCSALELKQILAECVYRGGVEEASYVAAVLTRGNYIDEDAERTRDIFRTKANLIAYAIPYKWIALPEDQERGLTLIVSKTPRIPDTCLNARIKNYHWGDLTSGKFEARSVGADGAIHLSISGYVTEGAGFNILFYKDGTLFTPENNVLEGITCLSALDIANEMGIPTERGDYPVDQLREADEIFITSTAGGIMPVVELDGRLIGDGRPGKLSMSIRSEYWYKREHGWLSTPVSNLISE